MKPIPTAERRLRAALDARQRITDGRAYSAAEGPHEPLGCGLRLNLVQGVIYTGGGVDLVAVRLPEAAEDILAIEACVAAVDLPAGVTAKRAALRAALGDLYRERRPGRRETGTVESTVRLTPAEWAKVEAAGNGSKSAGVRALLAKESGK